VSFSKMLAILLTWLKLTGQWDHSWFWVVLLVIIGRLNWVKVIESIDDWVNGIDATDKNRKEAK